MKWKIKIQKLTFQVRIEIILSGTTFVLEKNYQFIKRIGVGAYGVVISCKDLNIGMNVAVKKIPNAFEDLIDAKRILREIKLLCNFPFY